MARRTPPNLKEIDAAFARSVYVARDATAEGDPARGVGSAAAPPPLLTGGEFGEPTVQERIVLTVDGKTKFTMARRGYGGDTAFIDWLNVTVNETTFWGETCDLSDDKIIMDCSIKLESIFGFGITSQCEHGRNFYKRSYVIGDNWGFVCHGGQRNSLLVMLSGEGCAIATYGWEKRLHQWLTTKAVQPRITRIDLAHDCYKAEYTVDQAKSDYENGLYTVRGHLPDCEQRGNWHTPNGKGRSFYSGHRSNGKYSRVYEKGKQLGDKASEWVRIEVEFKSVDRIIPFDVLLKAGEYLAAAYPAFAWISEKQCRITTTRNRMETSYKSTLDWLEKQCGAALWVACEIEGSAEKLLQKIMQVGKFPKRLKLPMIEDGQNALHRYTKPTYSVDFIMEHGIAAT